MAVTVGLASDGTGNVFVSDYYQPRVRKIATNGIISTYAGSGGSTYSGDGGVATNAGFVQIYGLGTDGAGNLFIADNVDCRIRKVGINGIISTVAGNGSVGYAGDGGVATNASLRNPYAVTVDSSGNLFIAEFGNADIRKVGTNGIITTIAGGGIGGDGGSATNSSLNGPAGIAADFLGNLFIADQRNYRIRKINANGIISTYAGNGTQAYAGDGGAATNASLENPFGLAIDSSGNLFIGDKATLVSVKSWPSARRFS